MSTLTPDGTGRDARTRFARPNSQLRERGQGNMKFPCSADHEQDWQPYPFDPHSAIWDDNTYSKVWEVGKLGKYASWVPLNTI